MTGSANCKQKSHRQFVGVMHPAPSPQLACTQTLERNEGAAYTETDDVDIEV
jgi:hypothetical protein